MAEQIPAYYTDPRAPRPRGIVPNMIQNGGRTTFVDVSRPSSGRGGSGAEESGRASTSYAANQGLAGATPSGPAAPAMPGLSAGYVAPQAGGAAPATGGTASAAGGTAPSLGGWGPTIGGLLGGAAGLALGGPVGAALGGFTGYQMGANPAGTTGAILGGLGGGMMAGPVGLLAGGYGGYKAGNYLASGPETVSTSKGMQPGGALNASSLFTNAMQQNRQVY